MTNPVLLYAVVGIVLIALAIPMLLRRIPPNPIYGLRLPATYRDEQVWYDANAASGRDLVVLGIVAVLFGVLPPSLGWGGGSHALTWGFGLAAGMLFVAVLGWRRANRMLRARSMERHGRDG